MFQNLPVNTEGALSNFLAGYRVKPEEVLTIEATSNAIDGKAKNIWITLKSEPTWCVEFLDDGFGMTREKFFDYHILSLSSKKKDEGIGWAGNGAKVYLGSPDSEEILTITGTGEEITASKMKRDGSRVQFEFNIPLEKIVDHYIKPQFKGTLYSVTLKDLNYYWLRNHLKEILPYWFNLAIMNNLNITVKDDRFQDVMKVNADLPVAPVKRTLSYRRKNKFLPITCYFYVCDKEIPEHNRHIVYNVFGKRIKRETAEFQDQIVQDYKNKVFCMADVSLLADYVVTSKDNFSKDPFVTSVQDRVATEFKGFLKNRDLISDTPSVEENSQSNMDVRIFENRLGSALLKPEFAFLNPLLPQSRASIIESSDGTVVFDTKQGGSTNTAANGGGGGRGEGGTGRRKIFTNGGDPAKDGYEINEEGNQLGKEKEKKMEFPSVTRAEHPTDSREGWFDKENGTLVYNTGHPLARNYDKYPLLDNNNMARVVISSLIKDADKKDGMGATEGLDVLASLMYMTEG